MYSTFARFAVLALSAASLVNWLTLPVLAQENQTPPAAQNVPAETTAVGPKLLLKPGQPLSSNTDTEDLVATYDVNLARQQVAAYPDSPEAGFILAVALSRTSHVEEALQEVRRSRKLAEAKGGPIYFDKMISSYEEMLKNFPKENQVRYGLAWAYYMKAYLLAKYSRRQAQPVKSTTPQAAKPSNPWELAAALGTTGALSEMPHIQGALDRADSSQVPQIKKYYEAALKNLDDLLAQEPGDIWAKTYRAFLKAEYTGNLPEAMAAWQACQAEAPDNPAPYFFLGEGYLRQGNLKECFANISRAISLRATGK
jgi:tetratricopeptide (TPR) repeat protein